MRKTVTLLAVLLLSPTLSPAQATASPLDFSGILFGGYQIRTDDAAKAQTGGKPMHRFDMERAYLTFRMPAGERGSIRITTDIFQNAAAGFYGGWVARLKYGYFQYDMTKNLAGVQGLAAVARIGMLHTVVIDHIESFWPRFISSSSVERAGFFSSADVGASTHITLPNRRGEIYATITNGNGYTAPESDRFKDFAARLTLTPFANDSGWLRSFAISPWYYKGWSGSAFATSATPVTEGNQKDRRGIFVGLKERRLTVGAEFSQRVEQVENTPPAARVVSDRTSNLTSGFALVRPLELLSPARRSRLGLLARVDRFQIDTDASATNPNTRLAMLGAFYELNARSTFTVDFQELAPQAGSTTPIQKTWFMHYQIAF